MLTAREEYIWNSLIEYNVATEDEIQLVIAINGVSEESLNDILYARTGYRSIEQMLGGIK